MKHPTYNPETHVSVLVKNPESCGWPDNKPTHLGWVIVPRDLAKPVEGDAHSIIFTRIEPVPVRVEESWPDGWRWSDKK